MPRQRTALSADLVRLYTVEHLTLAEIGERIGMTRQSVWLRLQRLGVAASRGTWLSWPCAYCGSPMQVRRKRWRSRQRLYCSSEHYYAALENPTLVLSRHGTRLARAIVSQHFDLDSEHVVHHVDGNERHNDLANLEVYASSADHHRIHRGRAVAPIWAGTSVGPLSLLGRP